MRSPAPRLVLHDSVTGIGPADAGAFVVTGSHAGRSVVRYACAVPLWAVAFNDAGIGKDGAGIAALAELEARGVAALAVAHGSARIGEAVDTWASGVVSAVNARAAALGFAVGQRLCEAVTPAAR